MRASARTRLVAATTVLIGLATYLFLTEGLEAIRYSEVRTAGGRGNVPEFVHDPPSTVQTTADYGPVGPVAVVFAGTEVLTGLTGTMENPWVAVSSMTGEYRALSAPHLPEPGRHAVAVSSDGRTIAWGSDRGVVLYDAVTDEARVVSEGLASEPVMGDFSPDGSLLLVHDGTLHVLEVASGQVVGTLAGVDRQAARQAVWHPRGQAVTYVAGGELVGHAWAEGTVTAAPTTIRPDAALAWSPSGDQLAAMRDERGVRRVEVFDVVDGGRLRRVSTVEHDGYAQQELLGFTGDGRVTVTALTLETATIPLVYNMSTTDAFPPTRVMQLPASDLMVDTIQVAADPLAAGSVPFGEPDWPASDLAKLTASVILTVFLLGMYLTRRPRANTWAGAVRRPKEKVGV